MKRILASLALAVGITGPAAAQEVELSLSHWVPAVHPLQVLGMEMWAKSVEEDSNGRIKVTIYPAQQLGAAPDHYDMARDGIVDMAFVSPGYQPGRFPIFAAAELPFQFTNAKGGSAAAHEWYMQFAGKEMGDTFVCMVNLHDPGTFHGKTGPLLMPSDFKGMNIRPANGTLARAVNLIGGASVQVPAPGMRDALEKGTADVTASPWGSLFTFGAQDIVTHHLDMPLYVSAFTYNINKDKLASLSDENRKVIMDHCTPEWSEKVASGWADVEAAGRQKIIDLGGHTLYTPNAEQIAVWKETMAPLLDEWKANATKAGIDADAAYDSFVATLKKYNSFVE